MKTTRRDSVVGFVELTIWWGGERPTINTFRQFQSHKSSEGSPPRLLWLFTSSLPISPFPSSWRSAQAPPILGWASLSPAVLPEPVQLSSMPSLEETLKAYSPLLYSLTSKTSSVLPSAPKLLFSHHRDPIGLGLLQNLHLAEDSGSGSEVSCIRKGQLPQDHVC